MHDLHQAPSIGILVPPSNPVVEPELRCLLPTTMKLYTTRFPVMPGTTLLERNRRYLDLYPETLKCFGELPLDAALIALTGPSYRLLPEGDAALVAKLSADTPVQTASNAIRQALAALSAHRIALVSPYPQWLTDEAAAYWTAAGHEIVQVVKISESFRAYALTTEEVATALRSLNAGVEAIVMSGTGMLTLPAILAARQGGRTETKTPFLSSNLCAAWWFMHHFPGHTPPQDFRAASPELTARLSRTPR